MDVRAIETPTRGRVLVVPAARSGGTAWLVACHGYGQSADDVLAQVMEIPGAGAWNLAAPQALHRFYSRAEERVIASWMTRQDRELAIADNIEYLNRVVADVAPGGARPLVFLGFSQGAAMAYRAAVRGRHAAAGVIALGGDIPPELKTGSAGWPAVLIAAGDAETWYTPEKMDADAAFLAARGVRHDVVRFKGGHEWTDEFRAAAGRWLASMCP